MATPWSIVSRWQKLQCPQRWSSPTGEGRLQVGQDPMPKTSTRLGCCAQISSSRPLPAGGKGVLWCCWNCRSLTANPAPRKAPSSWCLLKRRAWSHWGCWAPTTSRPPCRRSGRQWGASWGPAIRGHACQSPAKLPRPSTPSAGCSGSPPALESVAWAAAPRGSRPLGVAFGCGGDAHGVTLGELALCRAACAG